MCMYMCVHVCMCLQCIRVHAMHICACVHMCVYTCACVNVYVCVCECVYGVSGMIPVKGILCTNSS